MSEGGTCGCREQVGEWMSLALDGILDPESRHKMDLHLAACLACQAEWNAMERVGAALSRLPAVGPPPGFAENVERRVVGRERDQRRLFGGVALLTGTWSLAILGVGIAVLTAMGALALSRLGPQPAILVALSAIFRAASGLGRLGNEVRSFLADALYGVPVVAALALGLALLLGICAWAFGRGERSSEGNGHAP